VPPLPFVGGGWCHSPLAWPVWACCKALGCATHSGRAADGQPLRAQDGRLRCGRGPLDEAADSATLNFQAGVFCSLMVTVAMQMVKVYIVATLPAPPSFPM